MESLSRGIPFGPRASRPHSFKKRAGRPQSQIECSLPAARTQPAPYSLHIAHTPKPNIRRCTVGRVAAARIRAVTVAVARVTQVRAAAHHASVAAFGPGRIFARTRRIVRWIKTVPAPLPDVSSNLIDRK